MIARPATDGKIQCVQTHSETAVQVEPVANRRSVGDDSTKRGAGLVTWSGRKTENVAEPRVSRRQAAEQCAVARVETCPMDIQVASASLAARVAPMAGDHRYVLPA